MMYLTRTITPDHTPLIVGEFFEDSVLACTPDKQVLRISRFCIETPVLCCKQCAQPVILLEHPHTHKEYAECPNYAQHMYEKLYVASINTQQYNRKQRHTFTKQAKYWLNKWKRSHDTRCSTATAPANAD